MTKTSEQVKLMSSFYARLDPQKNLPCVGSNTTDLNCQFGDAGLNGLTSVADAHVHAVILGVIQVERPHFQNDGCCTVCEKEKNTNTELSVLLKWAWRSPACLEFPFKITDYDRTK